MLGRNYLAAGLAGVLAALSLNAAQACEGSKVLFEDKFVSLDPAWSPVDDHAAIAGGKLGSAHRPKQPAGGNFTGLGQTVQCSTAVRGRRGDGAGSLSNRRGARRGRSGRTGRACRRPCTRH